MVIVVSSTLASIVMIVIAGADRRGRPVPSMLALGGGLPCGGDMDGGGGGPTGWAITALAHSSVTVIAMPWRTELRN